MALKKSELYSSLWASCDELRGGSGRQPVQGLCPRPALRQVRQRQVRGPADGTLIVKWDLDNQKPMKVAATRRIVVLISELEAEGLL